MTERRLFFALWPDDAVRERLVRAARAWLVESDARPVRAGNLHLTLAYLGLMPDWRIAELCAAAGRIEAGPGTITLDRVGWWKKPRVAWMAPSRAPSALLDLESALGAELGPLGWRRDHDEFAPHITVARKQSHAPQAFRLDPIEWTYAGFVLCESVSTRDGVRYEVIERWPA